MKKIEQIVWSVATMVCAVLAILDPDAVASMIYIAMMGLSLILAKLCGLERR